MKQTVYIIDDDAGVRVSLKVLMASLGLASETFESGHQFLEQLDSIEAGCLILDIQLPGIDGLELQTRLNDLGVDLPTIIITGHGNEEIRARALGQGAVAYFEKPHESDALQSTVFRVLQSRSDNSDSITSLRKSTAG